MKFKIHFNDLPEGILIELEPEFCKKFCRTILNIEGLKSKLSFGEVTDIKGWKAARLFNSENRFPVKLLETLRRKYFLNNTKFSIENIEMNIKSIGMHSDNYNRIYNPNLPFDIKDLTYVWAHLVFDGCGRPKGSYFMAPQDELLEYHKNRLQAFGKISINFNEKGKQLYVPWTLVYIVKEIFQVNSFKSLEARVPKILKELAMKNKEIANEIIKAAIIDEGWIEDKISFAISNEKLCRDVWEITKPHYEVGRFPEKPRIRRGITNKRLPEWRWIILSKSMKDFYDNISFPLSHKQERLEFVVKRQSRRWYKRKPNETKKLITKSLLKSPKTIKELTFELNVRTTSILNLINGIHCKSQNTDGLKDLGVVGILHYRRNPIGKRTGKFPVYGIINKEKSLIFLGKAKNVRFNDISDIKGMLMLGTGWGKELKKIRKKYGLKQEEIGNIVNLNRSSISAFEREIRCPRIKILAKLQKRFPEVEKNF